MSDGERLEELERRLAALRLENRRLRNLLKVTDGVEPPPEQPALAHAGTGVVTDYSLPSEKVDFYARLFGARRDVYAYYWENQRKGTKGWSPATRHKYSKAPLWDRRPLPLTREILSDHLRRDNDFFLGLYPLLPDATCWWLAADFDGANAMLDAHAYVKAAASLGVPCGLEVSQSGKGLILPRGLREQAEALIIQAGSRLVCDDERGQGVDLDVTFAGTLDDRQAAAVDAMLAHEDGVLKAPTGSGKTVMACAIIAERAVSTLVLINKRALASQWRQQILTLLGINHLAAGSYESVVARIGAAWWLGLTATPERKDGLEQVTNWHLGPIRHVMRDTLPDEASLVTPYDGPRRTLRVHETGFRVPDDLDLSAPGAISQLGERLADDEVRNAQIVADLRDALEAGRKCLALSRRRDHLTTLAELMPEADPMIMRGGIGARELTRIREKIADAEPRDPLLVLTTVPYGGEGFDAPVIDTVFLVGPISYPGLVIQAVGRALRRYPGKQEVVVHDYVDAEVLVLNAQYSRRRVAYRQLGFSS